MDSSEIIYLALRHERISPCVAVPCRKLNTLLMRIQQDPERRLIYPAREEEGLGICVGAYLAGCFPVMLLQNSGLGNLVGAYCSLNQFFDIPLLLLVSQRGTASEPVAAQRPMGAITTDLLDLLHIEHHTPDRPQQAEQVIDVIGAYKRARRSCALLLSPEFWS